MLEYIVAAEWIIAGALFVGASLIHSANIERSRKRSFEAMYGRYVLARRKDDLDFCVVYDYSEARAKIVAKRLEKFDAVILPFKRKS